MKVKTQLIMGNAAILGIFIIVSIVIVFSIKELVENSRWVTHTYTVIRTADQIMASMVDRETGVRGYMATGDEGFLEPYHAGKEVFAREIAKAKELVNDNPGQVTRFEEVETLAGE